MFSEAVAILTIVGVLSAVILITVAIAGDMDISDVFAAVWKWLTKPFVHRHDGPVFKVTGEYGRGIEGAAPQKVVSWQTCKKCSRTFAVERYESVDEFESRQKPEAPKS